MKYKELLEQLQHLTQEQLEHETLVFIRDKEKFVSLNNSLYFVTEFDEYDQDLETDQPYFRV
mgnify:FL=1